MSDTFAAPDPAGLPPAPPPQPDLTQPSGWDGPPPSQSDVGPGPGQPPVADPYPTQADAVAAQANPGPIPPVKRTRGTREFSQWMYGSAVPPPSPEMQTFLASPSPGVASAPTPVQRHPLGVGDVHDRLVALEQWAAALMAKVQAL